MKIEPVREGINIRAYEKSRRTIIDEKRDVTEYIEKEKAYVVKISEEALRILKRVNDIKLR